jgi:hypothetical protein
VRGASSTVSLKTGEDTNLCLERLQNAEDPDDTAWKVIDAMSNFLHSYYPSCDG